eukprot:COSAG06_NODE_14606_length_1143_cov_9.099617_1_plen_60_part_00
MAQKVPFSYLLSPSSAPGGWPPAQRTAAPQASPGADQNGIFEPFIYKNEHFAKTGSGQT